MTETTTHGSASGPHTTPAAALRAQKRRRAEWRLRAYGILAIALAGLALISLLWTVVGNARGALTETYITLPVTIDAAELDLEGTPDAEAILRANFAGLTKSVLREVFPNAKDRKVKRQLYDVVSGGASFELAELVSGDPSLLGQSIDYDFLASDVTDLYLKGEFGRLQPQPVQGLLTIDGSGKSVDVNLTANDMQMALGELKTALRRDAARLDRQAALQDNGAREFARRASASTTDAARAENQAQAESRAAKRDELIAEAAALRSRADAPGGREKLSRDTVSVLIRAGGGWFRMTELSENGGKARPVIAPTQPISQSADWKLYMTELPEISRKVSDNQIIWIEALRDQGRIDTVFNTRFFTASDSREPELAGIRGATMGSILTMLVTFVLAFPVGVLAAIYLEEFAPRNRLTDFIEVNINNLAAVPSIVFGLLGLAIFLGVFGVPRSAPLAGGIVLALMTLPTIIIASRASIRAVPPSIRDAALGLGASRLQTSFHHVLPLAMPGILTGTIIGMAQALGETAPLILIGMVAFIVDVPTSITDSATVLPVQVFRWSDFPERAFEARTAAAICVLLIFLIVMNALAVYVRRRFERRW